MKKLAIVTSHPIQYNAPLFKLLTEHGRLSVRVFYTWGQSSQGKKYDPHFGKDIDWDIPLLEGYDHVFVENIAKDPGTHHFKGIVNPTLNREIEGWKPDAVLVFGWSFTSHLRCMRHFYGKVPVLFRGDSTLLGEQPGLKRLMRRIFLKWVYRHVDYALYTGSHNKEYYLRHGMREDQLVFAPHAVDNDRFGEPDADHRARAIEWRHRLGIADDHVVILFAGKLEPRKNPFFLTELAHRIGNDKIRIVITGNGPLEASLKDAAGAGSRVLFLDFQNQAIMPVLYRIGDVFVLCSGSETWGLGANEAMASGCALMLSDKTGGAVDLVKEGVNGIIFGLTDYDKCREFAETLVNHPQRLADMKKASRRLIGGFSYARIVGAIETLLLKQDRQ
ncbi:MAG TPA: glycosyltransferase family 4 protein [Puia sp.]|jgi:glycosyltransferase involved in cell wall biosynthesis|nr:glycosyltransferase family 4 protein [Puia sp.]